MEDVKLICNCDDEFKLTPCPVHHKDVKIDRKIIVTDNDLVVEKYRRLEGLVFICSKCSAPAIMDFHKFCPNCGAEVMIHSKILTDVINKSTTK